MNDADNTVLQKNELSFTAWHHVGDQPQEKRNQTMSKLIKCKSCDTEMASDAKQCPKCGSPNKKSGCLKIAGIGIAAFFILGIFGAILSEDGGTSGSSSSSSSSSGSAAVAAQEKFAIGDSVKFDDAEWTVIEAREMGSTLGGNMFTEAKQSEGKFVYVRYKVTNNTNEEQSVLFTPAVQDSKGRRFEELNDLAFYLPEGQTGMTMEQLPSGLPKTFSAIFEVPADATGILFLTRNFATWSKEEKGVELGF